MQTVSSGEDLTQSTISAVERFNEAVNRHDLEAMMALMSEDCLFESTYPPPDGPRYQGQAAVRTFFAEFFRSSPQAVFETEELLACGERCVVRWRYRWVETDGSPGYVRGIDLFRVRNGKVAEKLSYVKG